MKSQLSIILSVILIIASACSQKTNNYSKIHVTKLVPADVFEVLPKSETAFKVYKNSDEIEGEYFELAMIEIEETISSNSTAQIIDALKSEAKALGGNGILVMEDSNSEKEGVQSKKMKVVAVYAFEQMHTPVQSIVLM